MTKDIPRTGVPILEARGIQKKFGGFLALDGVDIVIEQGTTHSLVGPNGAGKTTLFNVLTQFLQPTAGATFFKGQDITHLKPYEVAGLGIVRSFQVSAVFAELTVLENVRVARQRYRKVGDYMFWRDRCSSDYLDEECLAILELVGLREHAFSMTGSLAYGSKRAVEFATTLALEPEVLLLDEPTAGMVQADVERVAELIGILGRERTIVLIEHNLKVVAEMSDKITVLERGKILAEGSYAELVENPEVVRAYLGSDDA